MAQFVTGYKELERVLKQLPDALAKRVVLNGLRAGGRVLVKGMKERAPVRTGELAASPVVTTAGKATRGKGHAVIGFRKPTSRRVHLTEFGTENAPAQPFIRPTLDEDGAEAIKKIGEIMGRGVEREARKLAKR